LRANHPLHLLRDPAADAGACFPVRFIERVREHFTLDNFARIIERPPRKSSTTRSDHWGQRLVRRDGVRSLPKTAGPSSAKTMSPTSASALIRVALVSDSALFRSGLRSILDAYPAVSLVGEASALPVRDLVRAGAPHILLVDAHVVGALTACAGLRQNGGRPWVILAGADADDAWAVQALKCGARGILGKSATVETLIKAVRVVHQGQVWASHRVLTLMVEELAARSAGTVPLEAALRSRLSRREQDISQLIAGGLSNQEVAHRLDITEATVKAHLTHIFQKLMLRGRGQLAALYHRSIAPLSVGNGAKPGLDQSG
jgi:DNA-binding NarL/FixJ family response regulator